MAQNIEEIWGTMERANLRIIGRREDPGQKHRRYFQQNNRKTFLT